MSERSGERARPDEEMFKNAEDASSSLFDLRYLIGALFALYGVVLVVASFFVDDTKSGGLDMNLWLGIGMGVLGVFFLVWARTRPLRVEGESAMARADHESARRSDH